MCEIVTIPDREATLTKIIAAITLICSLIHEPTILTNYELMKLRLAAPDTVLNIIPYEPFTTFFL